MASQQLVLYCPPRMEALARHVLGKSGDRLTKRETAQLQQMDLVSRIMSKLPAHLQTAPREVQHAYCVSVYLHLTRETPRNLALKSDPIMSWNKSISDLHEKLYENLLSEIRSFEEEPLPLRDLEDFVIRLGKEPSPVRNQDDFALHLFKEPPPYYHPDEFVAREDLSRVT